MQYLRQNRGALAPNFVLERLELRQLLAGIGIGKLTLLPPDPISAGAEWHYLQRQGKVPLPTFVGPLQTTGGPEAPTLTSTIEGINFDENGLNNGGVLSVPPDPHGAVGLNHVVSVTNSSIEWHTKAGIQQYSQPLSSFFAALSPLTTMFDPKVVYDTQGGRFVAVALDQTDTATGDPSNTSQIMLAVSVDSDPNNGWRFHAINSMLNIGGINRWADFPQIGFDSQAVYVTANMFSFGAPSFAGSRLWIVNKSPFYSDPGPNAATVTLHDPSTAAGLPGAANTLTPAKLYGTPPPNMGTFLTNTSFVSGANEVMTVIRITNPLSATPTFSNTFVGLGDVSNGSSIPDAPQSGSATLIDTGSLRALDAVWRNNNLYVVNTVNAQTAPDTGTATARWYRFNANGVAAPTLGESGNISGEDLGAGTRTFFPSVAVDATGNVAIGFAASGPNIFGGAYYTLHAATDPAGSVQATGTLAQGLAPYVRTFGGGLNRWGDYSATVVDPANESFWIFNQYASTQGTPTNPPPEDGRWATRWGNFTATSAVPATPGVPDLASASDTGVSDSDNITNDNTPTFTGTGTTGLTVEILADGILVGSGVVVAGAYSITVSSPLIDDTFSITARQTDGFNTSPESAGINVTIDTVAPTLVGGNPAYNFLTQVHSLAFAFDENVGPTLATTDLSVIQLPATPVTTALSYDGGTNTGSFTFTPTFPSGTLADGRYQSTLTGAMVTDVAGNALASNNVFDFFFLNADANRDAVVNLDDFNILAGAFNSTGRTWSQGNFNYDAGGNVNLDDFNILATRFNVSVAPATSVRTANLGGSKRGAGFSDRQIESTPEQRDSLAQLLA